VLYHKTYFISEDKPWVTFVHGAGGSSSIWYAQIRDFKEHFNVLLLDLRGHGKSKNHKWKNRKDYSFKSIGNEVVDLLDHLNIQSTHFIGISLGTIITRELADRFPERIDSLIMGGAVMKLNLRGQILMKLGSWTKSLVPYLLTYKFFAWIIMPKKNHKKSRILFIDEARKLYQKEFKRWFSLVAEVNPILSFFRMRDCGIPTLYVMGEEDYMFLPSIKKLVANHVSATLEVFKGCGHVVNVERPKLFNQTTIAFIKSQSCLRA
jgi:pimeloyl-ACP methyl ester carboxylesterase